MTTIQLNMTVEQAQAVNDALDLYTRIAIGQFESVEYLMQSGIVPRASRGDTPRELLSHNALDAAADLLKQLKAVVGHPSNGSFGIGHPHVHVSGTRCYETHKVLSQALAELRDPNPPFKGVNYDGLVVRYTDDPAPVALVNKG